MHSLRLVEQSGLSCKESFIGLLGRGRHMIVLVVEWIKKEGGEKRVKICGQEMEYLLEKFRHHHHHRVDEMTCLDDERMKKRQNGMPCHDHFEVVKFI
ncbi:hypothetical protein Tco_0110399 [Tanacetum coccineum]